MALRSAPMGICWRAATLATIQDTGTVVINAVTKNYATVANITGSDEVWFNGGDNRYYLAARNAINPAGSPLGSGAVLGHRQRFERAGTDNPQSSGSHSVAADSRRNPIFVPQGGHGRYRRRHQHDSRCRQLDSRPTAVRQRCRGASLFVSMTLTTTMVT